MILDLARFVETERPHWTALEKTLDWLARDPRRKMSRRGPGAFPRLVSARLGRSGQGRDARVRRRAAALSGMAGEPRLRGNSRIAGAAQVPALALVHRRVSARRSAGICARFSWPWR